MPKICLSTWSLFLKKNYEGAMAFAIENGFQGLELWSNPFDFWPRKVTEKEIVTVRSFAREHHLSLAVHFCQGTNDLADVNEGHLEESLRQLKETIRVCHAMGGGLVVIHPGMMPYFPSHEGRDLNPKLGWAVLKKEAVERFKRSLSEAASVAEESEVILGLENLSHVKNCLQASFEELAEWVDEISHPALRVTLDLGHANLEGGVEKAIKILGFRIKHVHLNDNNGKSSQHGELGTGTLDWKAVTPFLRSFDGMLSLEVLVREDIEGAILRSKSFLENLLK